MNEYIFDYNVVLSDCPEYRKYLININDLYKKRINTVPELDNPDQCVDDVDGELEVLRQVSSNESNKSEVDGSDKARIVETPEIGPIHYILNPIYENPPLPAKMNPLQLMPPKRVLGADSKMYYPGKTGYVLEYQIVRNEYRDRSVCLAKYKVNETEDKIQLIHAKYWFDQEKNIVSDRKSKFRCLTYNKKTRNAYHTFRLPKEFKDGKRPKGLLTTVHGMLVTTSVFSIATEGVSLPLLKTFVDRVEKAVLKDVPDAYIPIEPPPKENKWSTDSFIRVPHTKQMRHLDSCNFEQIKLQMLLLQHKANTRLDWLTEYVLSNFDSLVSIKGLKYLIEGTHQYDVDYSKYYLNERKRRIRKIVPALRTGSLKKVSKALCGEFYTKLVTKLIDTVVLSGDSWVIVMTSMYTDNMPKILYHWLNDLLNNDILDKDIVKKVVWEVLKVCNDLGNMSKNSAEYKHTIIVIELWARANKRFIEHGGSLSRWFTWRDMYTMANDLNIRIRSNKFKDADDVKRRHDVFSELTRRDMAVSLDYKDVVFGEFDIPDKEYDEFTFVQLRTAEDLIHEGTTMHHCVAGYADRCVEGRSILLSMRKGDRGYITIELDGTSLPYRIRQQYSIHDTRVANDYILSLVNEWLKDINELHKNDTSTYTQICKPLYDMFVINHRLRKLRELEIKSGKDVSTYIDNECASLEKQLATLAMETTKAPMPEVDAEIPLPREDMADIIDMTLGVNNA